MMRCNKFFAIMVIIATLVIFSSFSAHAESPQPEKPAQVRAAGNNSSENPYNNTDIRDTQVRNEPDVYVTKVTNVTYPTVRMTNEELFSRLAKTVNGQAVTSYNSDQIDYYISKGYGEIVEEDGKKIFRLNKAGEAEGLGIITKDLASLRSWVIVNKIKTANLEETVDNIRDGYYLKDKNGNFVYDNTGNKIPINVVNSNSIAINQRAIKSLDDKVLFCIITIGIILLSLVAGSIITIAARCKHSIETEEKEAPPAPEPEAEIDEKE